MEEHVYIVFESDDYETIMQGCFKDENEAYSLCNRLSRESPEEKHWVEEHHLR